jgi:hypothetical protein
MEEEEEDGACIYIGRAGARRGLRAWVDEAWEWEGRLTEDEVAMETGRRD